MENDSGMIIILTVLIVSAFLLIIFTLEANKKYQIEIKESLI